MDYLLLSYVLYHNGLAPPHVAAGENLNLPFVGALLRRGGAFFMRRSFRGDTLYRAVFDEYLHLMFVRGYSVEYFIEGGRSRSGRTLTPRTGMLSMTISSYQRDPSRPICLMPVYFGYERIIEASTYMAELAGREKKQESLLDIVRTLRSLKHVFGQVTVNFGEPVLLEPFLEEHLPDWRTPQEVVPRAFSAACVELSRVLVTRINRAAAINPVNLVATVLLCTPRQVSQEHRLHKQIEVLLAIARSGVYSEALYVTPLSTTEIIAEAERISGIERQSQAFGDILHAPRELAVILTYYRNNVAHVFALPSLLARIVTTRHRISVERLLHCCRQLYPSLRREFLLPWEIGEIARVCEDSLGLLERLGLVRRIEGAVATPEPASDEYESLTGLAEIIEPTMERYFMVTALLAEGDTRTMDRLQQHAAAIAHELSAIYGINSPDFFEKSLFTTFISALEGQAVITTDNHRITIREGFRDLNEAIAVMLDSDVRYNVLQAIGRRDATRD